MKRREFISLLGGAAAWPPAAWAQSLPLIGFLNAQTAAGFPHLVAAFKQGLGERGFVDGQNVSIDYRWADQHFDQLPALADDLIGHHVDVIVATGGSTPVAIAATKSIPIVAAFGDDPVRSGYVSSLNRPGSNVTGAIVFSVELEAKRLELLNEIVPPAIAIGYLLNARPDIAAVQRRIVEAAGQTFNRQVKVAEASDRVDLEKAVATLVEAHVGGFVVGSNPLFNNLRDRLLALTAKLKIPVIYEAREFVIAGGLVSYGNSVPEVYRQIGIYAGRILKGEKAGELPILQPSKFDLAINLRTAKALGIVIPTSVLLRANEVIE